MVRRGLKRKIEIKKRETKEQRAVAFTRRRQTLFTKAAELSLLSGANIAVLVTPLAGNSDVLYSFSGYSTASEISDCYLNGKLPPKVNPKSKLGCFWWEDPDLYRSCDDLSELEAIADCIKGMKKSLMACLEKKEKLQLVSNSDQEGHIICSLDDDKSCSHIVSFDQTINRRSSSVDKNCGGSSSQFVSDSDQNPNSSVLI
ncbi:unnamed protein product [Microthlaspi erraticum]|uniref:MADS-box domain-containing protein n=1 Tax=Microthlaspi erraticum TaxID=1685480 RepID=A0A6D2JLL7_9BRAS|nr:unnamed protein product [Microthlaspi erraticum]